ncbi:hypothetical protein NDU88_008639 [Pleurodeles waltl]|uniref:Uncharacterized protein n=1 Tax=Pleurodeles waltl TaxID=8319 RepID=A0AAV7PTH4_PLEWA|nr:hypothetical protein NDU88_008639 [Pleurodeles waltl]
MPVNGVTKGGGGPLTPQRLGKKRLLPSKLAASNAVGSGDPRSLAQLATAIPFALGTVGEDLNLLGAARKTERAESDLPVNFGTALPSVVPMGTGLGGESASSQKTMASYLISSC